METEAKTEGLTKYLFSAPSWWQSLLIIILIGLGIEAAGRIFAGIYGISFVFTTPAILAFLLTVPAVNIVSRENLTWNRSGLLALASYLFSLLWMLTGFIVGMEIAFVFSLGFIFAIRLLTLVAIADSRMPLMFLPAIIQPLAGVLIGGVVLGRHFLIPATLSFATFALSIIVFIWLFDRPLKKANGISALEFINAFLAHLTDGSKSLEEYFKNIGETVSVPETSFFFKRDGKRDVLFVVPNLHPGPLSEIGGGNFPKHLHDIYSENEDVFISHGCADHDFNLVSESESEKIADAINKTRENLEFSSFAGPSARTSFGTVSVLSQRFGDSILMVTTRSPEMTEDLNYPVGAIVMAKGTCWYKNVGFVDAHNCMVEVTSVVYPASKTGSEYITAAEEAMKSQIKTPLSELSIGVSKTKLPFTREEGFGDMEVMTLITEVAGKKTAYVLFDGNNVHMGVREILRDAVLSLGVDEAEIMTTDSHVVNMISGRNPVGMVISPEKIIPHLTTAVKSALEDISPAKAAAATGICEDVVVFGSSRTIQLSATVNAMVTNLAPLAFLLLLASVLLTLLIFMFFG